MSVVNPNLQKDIRYGNGKESVIPPFIEGNIRVHRIRFTLIQPLHNNIEGTWVQFKPIR